MHIDVRIYCDEYCTMRVLMYAYVVMNNIHVRVNLRICCDEYCNVRVTTCSNDEYGTCAYTQHVRNTYSNGDYDK